MVCLQGAEILTPVPFLLLPSCPHLRCSYEFSEADAACALQAIDSWVESAASGAQHISPEKVGAAIPIAPWVCRRLQLLLRQSRLVSGWTRPRVDIHRDSQVNI